MTAAANVKIMYVVFLNLCAIIKMPLINSTLPITTKKIANKRTKYGSKWNLSVHKKTPNAIQPEPYNNPLVMALLDSKNNEEIIANKPNKNKIVAVMISKPSCKMFCFLLAAKITINVPANNNKIERIKRNQTYLLNKLFIWISSPNTIIVSLKGNYKSRWKKNY